MRRFFLETLTSNISTGPVLSVPDDLLHRITNVLRLNEGDVVEFIDGKGLVVESRVTVQGKNKFFKVVSSNSVKRDKPLVGLAVSLIRRERFDLLVEKAVELGVDKIIPIDADHSRPFSEDSYSKLCDRWQRIADQALSQCRRVFRCSIEPVIKLSEVDKLKEFDEKIFFHFGGDRLSNATIKSDKSYLFIIGPEGGFSPAEIEYLNKQNFKFYSLVNNILRTETAAFYVLSIANFLSLKE